MKITLCRHGEDDQTFELHFSRRLPEFPSRRHRVGPFAWSDKTIDGRKSLPKFAEKMAEINQGRLETELVTPARTFLQLFEQLLIATPGIITVGQLDPYSLSIRIGRCFEVNLIGQQVAQALITALWPGERFELQHDPAHEPTTVNTDYSI